MTLEQTIIDGIQYVSQYPPEMIIGAGLVAGIAGLNLFCHALESAEIEISIYLEQRNNERARLYAPDDKKY